MIPLTSITYSCLKPSLLNFYFSFQHWMAAAQRALGIQSKMKKLHHSMEKYNKNTLVHVYFSNYFICEFQTLSTHHCLASWGTIPSKGPWALLCIASPGTVWDEITCHFPRWPVGEFFGFYASTETPEWDSAFHSSFLSWTNPFSRGTSRMLEIPSSFHGSKHGLIPYLSMSCLAHAVLISPEQLSLWDP